MRGTSRSKAHGCSNESGSLSVTRKKKMRGQRNLGEVSSSVLSSPVILGRKRLSPNLSFPILNQKEYARVEGERDRETDRQKGGGPTYNCVYNAPVSGLNTWPMWSPPQMLTFIYLTGFCLPLKSCPSPSGSAMLSSHNSPLLFPTGSRGERGSCY